MIKEAALKIVPHDTGGSTYRAGRPPLEVYKYILKQLLLLIGLSNTSFNMCAHGKEKKKRKKTMRKQYTVEIQWLEP